LTEPLIAFSYHIATDYEFVRMLANALVAQGVPAWYLDKLSKPTDVTMEQYFGGLFDWRREPQNWHATFLDHLCQARGIIVVLSEHAQESRQSVGRGMWRERPAIEYLSADNPLRVREVTRKTQVPNPELVSELATWGKQILVLPPVLRRTIDNPNSFNRPTGERGPFQLPELKTRATVWYELVRRDLYDVQWHCRRCGLQSDTYIMAEVSPPLLCPRCGFESLPYDSADVKGEPEDSERERQFLGKLTHEYTELIERLKKKPDKRI
jgi:ribosomal protein S27AE